MPREWLAYAKHHDYAAVAAVDCKATLGSALGASLARVKALLAPARTQSS